MKNLTVAIFLTLLFCAVSGTGEETADGFQQNPEYAVPAPNKTEAPVQQKGTFDDRGEKPGASVQQKGPFANAGKKTYIRKWSFDNSAYNQNRTTAYQPRSNTAEQTAGFAGTTDSELKDWELRNRPVPSSLPRVTNFRPRSGSCSRNVRNYRCYKNSCWSDGYYSRSSSSRIRISSGCDGRTRIQIRNHR